MARIPSFLLTFALSCGLVLAAPVNNTISGAILFQNGQDAQNLNSQFSNLSMSDPCQFGAQACISGAEAQCNSEGSWEAQPCPSNTQCFAVPNTKSQGTHLKCTDEQDAFQAIQNAGADGGICGNNSTNSGVCSGSDSGNTATVTILVAPSTTQTLDPQTTTIDQGSADSLISSVSATSTDSSDGATSTDSSDSATSTDSSSDADPTVSGSPDPAAAGALATGSGQATATPSIILLTPASSPTPSSTSDSSPTPDAALVSASSSSTYA